MSGATATSMDVPPHFELLRDDMGFGDLIGPMYIRKQREGRTFAWGFRVADKHMNRGGVVHGGMLVAFADQCLGALVYYAGGRKPCSTIDLATSFVAPGKLGDWIEGTGEVVRATRDVVFMHGRVYCGERTLLDVKGIWKLLDPARWADRAVKDRLGQV